jgi:hypothetical protein
MSTIAIKREAKRKTVKQFESYTVGTTFEEVCAQEVAAHDRRVLEIIKEMSQSTKNTKPPRTPK